MHNNALQYWFKRFNNKLRLPTQTNKLLAPSSAFVNCDSPGLRPCNQQCVDLWVKQSRWRYVRVPRRRFIASSVAVPWPPTTVLSSPTVHSSSRKHWCICVPLPEFVVTSGGKTLVNVIGRCVRLLFFPCNSYSRRTTHYEV